jgi:hypothetical protein
MKYDIRYDLTALDMLTDLNYFQTLAISAEIGTQYLPNMRRYYYTLHYTTLHYITLHCTALHYSKLHCTTLHYITLNCTTLHYITLHYTTLHCITLHYTALHYTALRYNTLHYTAYITLHYPTITGTCLLHYA